MGPPGQETKFLPETPARQIFCAHFGGLFIGRLSFAMLLLGVFRVRVKVPSSEPSPWTACQIRINFILFIICKCELVKWCFINKVREEHVQIINLIITRGAQSVINPVNKIRGVYIQYTQQIYLCSLTVFQHPSATPSPHLQLFLS